MGGIAGDGGDRREGRCGREFVPRSPLLEQLENDGDLRSAVAAESVLVSVANVFDQLR